MQDVIPSRKCTEKARRTAKSYVTEGLDSSEAMRIGSYGLGTAQTRICEGHDQIAIRINKERNEWLIQHTKLPGPLVTEMIEAVAKVYEDDVRGDTRKIIEFCGGGKSLNKPLTA